MEKDNKNFKIYPLWDFNLPKIPPRNKLLLLEPAGVGTQRVESFTGYLNRLAQEHYVSPTALVRYVLEQNGETADDMPKFARSLNGLNNWAHIINRAFFKLLSLKEIRYTTLLPIKHTISNLHLLRMTKLWCPLCLEEQKDKNEIVYEHLVWNIAVVQVCSIHKIPLIGSCPTCGFQITGVSIMPYGYCCFCYSWLGYSRNDKAFKDAKLKRKTIHPKLFWIDAEVRKIAELLPVAESRFTKENFKEGIRFLIKKITNGNASRFCRKSKIEEVELMKLLRENTLISITRLINICYQLNISPLDLLSGKTAMDLQFVEIEKPIVEIGRFSRYPDLYLEKNRNPITKKVKKEKIKAAEKIMIEALNKEIPPAFEEICRKVKINGVILRRILPELSRELKDRYLEYKEKVYKNRWQI